MREIKFRGKSDTDWVYGHLLKVDDWNQAEHEHFDYFIQTDVMEQGEYNMYYITDNNTIGQYTGLHDKNGKEIYEGDIVKILGGEYEQGFYEWDETVQIKDFIYDGFNLMMDISQIGNQAIEVIGNIWEDSDLLNDSKNTETN